LPNEGIGVAILTNLHSPTVPFMYGSLYTILDEVLGAEYEDWSVKFHGNELPKEEIYHDCEVNYFKEEQVTGTKPSLSLSQYAGTYYDKGYGTLKITEMNNELFMHYRDMDVPLNHYHYDVFRADNILEDILLITLPVSFDVKNGKVQAVAVRFEPLVPDILFEKL